MLAAVSLVGGCGIPVRKDVRAGLPESLAIRRAGMIQNIRYQLTFDLRGEIKGKAIIRFDLVNASENVVLDFKAPKKNILSVSVPYRWTQTVGDIVVLRYFPKKVKLQKVSGREAPLVSQ